VTLLFVKGGCALFLLVLSAGFSLAETSFMSLSRLQLARLARARPGRLDFWQKDPDRALAVLLLMNNVVNAGLAVLSVSIALDAAAFLHFPFRWGRGLFPVASGILLLVFGEVGPKVAARARSESLALALAPAVKAMTDVLGPLMHGLLEGVGGLLSWLSRTVRTDRAQWDQDVIRALLDHAPLGSPLRRVLKNVVGFAHTPVSAVMVPRLEIAAVDLRAGFDAVIARILSSGYSRLPVHRGSIDAIEGMVYSKDLLAQLRSGPLIALEDLVRPLPCVPPDAPLARLLREFRAGHHHMALVAEPGGKVLGLVTLQDTLEAIVGEIAQEPRLS
jgi:CBS domain containing-hemolysin-like protein